MILDAFSIEVLNRLRQLPIDGHPLAQLNRVVDEVRADWKRDCPEALAAVDCEILAHVRQH